MATHPANANLLAESASDANTGRQPLPEAIVRQRNRLERQLKSKQSALNFLSEHGFLTPTGKLPKKYGG